MEFISTDRFALVTLRRHSEIAPCGYVPRRVLKSEVRKQPTRKWKKNKGEK